MKKYFFFNFSFPVFIKEIIPQTHTLLVFVTPKQMPVDGFKLVVRKHGGAKCVVAIQAPESAAPERTMECFLRTMLDEDDADVISRFIVLAARKTVRSPIGTHAAFPVGVRALVREAYERVERVFLISAPTRAALKNGTRIVLYEDVPKARAHEPESTGLAGREALAHTPLGTRGNASLGSRGHASLGSAAQIQVAIAPSSNVIRACTAIPTVKALETAETAETAEAVGAVGAVGAVEAAGAVEAVDAPWSKDSGTTVGE